MQAPSLYECANRLGINPQYLFGRRQAAREALPAKLSRRTNPEQRFDMDRFGTFALAFVQPSEQPMIFPVAELGLDQMRDIANAVDPNPPHIVLSEP